jgi:hypothetical protein
VHNYRKRLNGRTVNLLASSLLYRLWRSVKVLKPDVLTFGRWQFWHLSVQPGVGSVERDPNLNGIWISVFFSTPARFELARRNNNLCQISEAVSSTDKINRGINSNQNTKAGIPTHCRSKRYAKSWRNPDNRSVWEKTSICSGMWLILVYLQWDKRSATSFLMNSCFFQFSQGCVVDIANISTEICSVYNQNLCLFATCLGIYSDNSLWVDWQESRPTRACAVTH